MPNVVARPRAELKLRKLPLPPHGAATVIDGFLDAGFGRALYAKLLLHPLGLMRINRANATEYPLLGARLQPGRGHQTDPALASLAAAVGDLVVDLEKRSLTLARMQLNVSSFGDPELIHEDVGSDLTAVYFANETWSADCLGETLFYDRNDCEVIGAVTPVPFRLLLFRSAARHRGGTPSRNCPVRRVTVALKYREP